MKKEDKSPTLIKNEAIVSKIAKMKFIKYDNGLGKPLFMKVKSVRIYPTYIDRMIIEAEVLNLKTVEFDKFELGGFAPSTINLFNLESISMPVLCNYKGMIAEVTEAEFRNQCYVVYDCVLNMMRDSYISSSNEIIDN